MSDKTLYFAYGSNINLDQMAHRCPDAKPLGPVTLDNYELLFRGRGDGGGFATIAPCEGGQVQGLLWEITPQCERSLDIYESYPRFYDKQTVSVRDRQGVDYQVMAYVMTGELSRNPAAPSQHYYAGIAEGLWQNKMSIEPLEQAYRNLMDEKRFQFSRNAQQRNPPGKKKTGRDR